MLPRSVPPGPSIPPHRRAVGQPEGLHRGEAHPLMIDSIRRLIHDHQRFLLTTHIRPDGDALGSQLALGRFLTRLGKDVTLINSDPAPYNLGWLPGADAVEVFDGGLAQRERIHAADAVFILDVNAEERLGRLASAVRNAPGTKVLIDHHPDPEPWFDLHHARTNVSSTGELVYELIAAEDPGLIDADLATTLYTAIMTDTGSFRYSNTTPQVHRIVATLLERGGIEPAPIHTALFDTRTMESLRLLGKALETVTLVYDGAVGYMVVTQRMYRDTGTTSEDTEGFVGYVLSIESVRAALIFLETESGTKISFRSKGDTAVNGWARAFGGGGHPNAAGAYVRADLDQVVRDVIAAAPRYLDLVPASEANGALSPEDAAYLSSLLDLKTEPDSR